MVTKTELKEETRIWCQTILLRPGDEESSWEGNWILVGGNE